MDREERWNAKISIQGNTVRAWAADEEKKADEYCFYLYDINNVKQEQSKWVKNADYSFTVQAEGIYRVKIFRKKEGSKTSKMTQYADYYSKERRTEFQRFCESRMVYTHTAHLRPDDLCKMKYPYKDFAVIVSDRNEIISQSFLDVYHLKKYTMQDNGQWVHVLAEDLERFYLDGILFSGIGKCEKTFTFGEHDVKKPVKISDEMIGNFTYVKKCADDIEIGTDYFGTGKLYDYIGQDICMITNNYHLLLLMLNDAGIKLEADNKLILALLCKSRQAFQQSITREREMIGTYMLPADKMFVVKNGTAVIKDKSICKVFHMDKTEDIHAYEHLLEEGREEIIENTRMILADTRYDTVVSGLTGGLDSRLVYGALSSLDEYQDKIVLHADGSENAVDEENSDVSIALKVNSIKKYDYNTVRIKYIWKDIETAENEMISLGVLSGYYYPHSYTKMMAEAVILSPAFALNGFYGEICCRPYYTRTLLQKEKKYEDAQAFLAVVANRAGILSGSAYEALKETLEKELEQLPGDSFFEKWEMHYLFYRNGLHCNTIWEYDKNIPQWGPLQSKALFQYKHLTFGKIKGISEQLHLIYRMDPKLLRIPFERPKDEAERKEFLKNVCENGVSDLDIRKFYETEKFHWKKRMREKREHSLNKGWEGKDFHELWNKGSQYDITIKERIYEILHRLMQYQGGIFRELFGIAVFQAVQEERFSMNELKTMYRKLVSVYVQIQIFE